MTLFLKTCSTLRNIFSYQCFCQVTSTRIFLAPFLLHHFSQPKINIELIQERNFVKVKMELVKIREQSKYAALKISRIKIFILRRAARQTWRLGVFSSYSIRVKKYNPQIEHRGFFDSITHFYERRLWNPQSAFENFRQRFYLLWCLLLVFLILYFKPFIRLFSPVLS